MVFSENLRSTIKRLPPISDEEAERLTEEARQTVGGRFTARPGEDQTELDTLQGVKEYGVFRIAVAARQIGHSIEAYFDEREVITPAEEEFARRHRLTAEDLEAAWGERREGVRGRIHRQEVERRADLRDQFFIMVDGIGAQRMGDGYDYGVFVGSITSDALLQAVQARLDAQQLE